MSKRYPAEFRGKVLDLVAAGRPVAQVAADLAISDQTIYVWRRQHLVDTGQLAGRTSSENAELVAARRRITELEAEVAIHRRAAQLLGAVVCPQKTVRGGRGDGLGEVTRAAGLSGAWRLGVGLLRLAHPAAIDAVFAARVADRADPGRAPGPRSAPTAPARCTPSYASGSAFPSDMVRWSC